MRQAEYGEDLKTEVKENIFSNQSIEQGRASRQVVSLEYVCVTTECTAMSKILECPCLDAKSNTASAYGLGVTGDNCAEKLMYPVCRTRFVSPQVVAWSELMLVPILIYEAAGMDGQAMLFVRNIVSYKGHFPNDSIFCFVRLLAFSHI